VKEDNMSLHAFLDSLITREIERKERREERISMYLKLSSLNKRKGGFFFY